MIAEKEQLNKRIKYDYRVDHFGEIKRLEDAITTLEGSKDTKNIHEQMHINADLRVLKETLSELKRKVDLMASYISGEWGNYSAVCRKNIDQFHQQGQHFNYVAELRKLYDYKKIEVMCLNLTPVERQHFLNQYNELKQEEKVR